MTQKKYAAFGRMLRRARMKLARKQRQLAEELRITAGSYQKIEWGYRGCSLATLDRLRRTLELDGNALLKALRQRSKPVKPSLGSMRESLHEANGPHALFGQPLRAARLKKRLTQAQVAEAVVRTQEFYSRIENGWALPSMQLLARLHDCLEFDANHLLDALWKPPPHQSTDRRFGMYMAHVRNRKGYTTAKVAKAAGYSTEHYEQIEAGTKFPTLAGLVRLYRLLQFNGNTALRRIDPERLERCGQDVTAEWSDLDGDGPGEDHEDATDQGEVE